MSEYENQNILDLSFISPSLVANNIFNLLQTTPNATNIPTPEEDMKYQPTKMMQTKHSNH